MNRIFSILIALSALLITSSLFAQPPAATSQTKIEAALAKRANLAERDIRSLGEIVGQAGVKIKMEGLVIFDIGRETDKVFGMRVVIADSGKNAQSDVSYLDKEDVDNLTANLAFINTIRKKWLVDGVAREHSEIVYETKNDFQIGFYQQDSTTTGFVKSDKPSASRLLLREFADFGKLKDMLDKAAAFLKPQ